MIRGVRGMMEKTLRAEKGVAERAIVLGTLAAMHAAGYSLEAPKLEGDGFWLSTAQIHGLDCLIVTSTTDLAAFSH
jgi:alpha-glucuronidase